MPRTPVERAVSRWTAIIIPLIMIGSAAYGTWCIVVKVAVEYLLNPPKSYRRNFHIHPRHGAAIAVLVLYFILLFLMAITYFRTLQVIWMDPGYIPLGNASQKGGIPGPEFTAKDAFVCDSNGKPRFCDHCNNFKPDRTHHCSEVERCVRRMDHFCPWAGGIISEHNMKFFLQFLFYGFFYNLFLIVTIGVLMQERKRKVSRYFCFLASFISFAIFGSGPLLDYKSGKPTKS
ncbi:zf-DHHC-domain-containing protein [Lophium mytilinum]|uniref:Palmitoyltransferase n=1 Tax=Lophium mytilinum TaxID=390894 RepID=A0A6A6QL32_9PEZI|nr:zf-DHHC-domain-containing protein [Lophium mytilinum]